jgi:hypothetical protein
MAVKTLLAIDPGNVSGEASFENGKLYLARPLPFCDLFRPGYCADAVVIEVPRHYPYNQKGDPNDLIDLAVRVGELKNHFTEKGATVQLVYPRTWKGTVPKVIHNKRVLRMLTKQEIDLLPKRPRAKDYDHNMLDAIGLGLWKLGRT